jgi:hypothetical protein
MKVQVVVLTRAHIIFVLMMYKQGFCFTSFAGSILSEHLQMKCCRNGEGNNWGLQDLVSFKWT